MLWGIVETDDRLNVGPMATKDRRQPSELEVWLRRALVASYDRVLCEPIPEEMLLLIRTCPDRD